MLFDSDNSDEIPFIISFECLFKGFCCHLFCDQKANDNWDHFVIYTALLTELNHYDLYWVYDHIKSVAIGVVITKIK